MKVAAIQSNYIPWKGYFDMINLADLFVFYDDVQYTKKDWRNRNLIKTPNGLIWLTVPCNSTREQKIFEVEITNSGWQTKHWRSIELNYSKAPFFNRYKSVFKEVYFLKSWEFISELNQYLIKFISKEILKSKTHFADSRIYGLTGRKEERVLDLLKKCGATEYICGPSAKSYINEKIFLKEGIKIKWMDYSGYPEYRQLYPPFCHEVSIIDLIFNEGPEAGRFMKSFIREKEI